MYTQVKLATLEASQELREAKHSPQGIVREKECKEEEERVKQKQRGVEYD